jgi:ribosomal protein L13
MTERVVPMLPVPPRGRLPAKRLQVFVDLPEESLGKGVLRQRATW